MFIDDMFEGSDKKGREGNELYKSTKHSEVRRGIDN